MKILIITIVALALVVSSNAQTTELNYSGSLREGSTQASGNYDFEFRLFDDLSAGTQIARLQEFSDLRLPQVSERR